MKAYFLSIFHEIQTVDYLTISFSICDLSPCWI